jgi:hypothetical protein
MLSAMASRIAAGRAKDGLPQIADVATTLEKTASNQADLEGVLKLTNELLELCRSPQTLDTTPSGAPSIKRGASSSRAPDRSLKFSPFDIAAAQRFIRALAQENLFPTEFPLVSQHAQGYTPPARSESCTRGS